LAPNDMPKHCCDMINVPESNNSFDAAICLFSIGHVDRVKAFKEMARLVKDNGVVFIYDMVRIKGDNKLMNELSYRVDGREDMENSAKEAGLYLDLYVEPVDQGWYGPSAMGGDFERYFSDVKPAIWRFKRHNNYVQ
jgi:SAM-dependent methyltransferase